MNGSVFFPKKDIRLTHSATVVGKTEKEGPLGKFFDFAFDEDVPADDTWEKAEIEAVRLCVSTLIKKASLRDDDIGAVFAGDLMNQCTAESFGHSDTHIPYFGLYGACSTYAEGAILAAAAIEAGLTDWAVFASSSSFATAERQYRTPLEYGSQRSPTAQCTVTGAGASLLEANASGSIRVEAGLAGRIIKSGISDITNMGAAMAPAAADTLKRFFAVTDTKPGEYDMIVTGDLGHEGLSILRELLEKDGIGTGDRLTDCGVLIFDRETQDVHCGGSGCGCSAVVTGAYLTKLMEDGAINSLILVGTGALMSPLTVMQKLDIPSIAHLICFRRQK